MVPTPTYYSEGFIEALSRIIFACTTGESTSTIKLCDPITGTLEDYQLLKTSPAADSPLGQSPVSLHSQLDLHHILDLLSAYMGKENVLCSSPEDSSSPTTLHLQFPSPHTRNTHLSGRLPLAPKNLETQNKPLQTQHFTVRPPILQALHQDGTPFLSVGSSSSDGTLSGSSLNCTPEKARRSLDSSLSLGISASSTSRTPSRLIGLGISTLAEDGSFDGLRVPTDGMYDNNPSPSDEARARARERRDRRAFGAAVFMRDHDTGAKVTPRPLSDEHSPSEPQALCSPNRPFARPATKISTPVSATASERVPPAAPAKRFTGRMPLAVEERMGTKLSRGLGGKNRTQHDVFALQGARIVSPEWQTEGFQRLGSVVGPGHATRGGMNGGHKRSPSSVPLRSTLGHQLRLWSYWMTPMNDAPTSMGRPAWRP